MFHQNLHHTGITSDAVVPPLVKFWNYQTGGSILESSPTVANGIVYVGSLEGNLYALNATTGAKDVIWSKNSKSHGLGLIIERKIRSV